MKPARGKIRIGTIAILGVTAFAMVTVATLTTAHEQLSHTSPWPVFRHDLANTGLSQYDTSGNTGQLRWSFVESGGTAQAIGASMKQAETA